MTLRVVKIQRLCTDLKANFETPVNESDERLKLMLAAAEVDELYE
jgi:RNase H-fold protein (predicted Holliday junction resolvase)